MFLIGLDYDKLCAGDPCIMCGSSDLEPEWSLQSHPWGEGLPIGKVTHRCRKCGYSWTLYDSERGGYMGRVIEGTWRGKCARRWGGETSG